RVEGCVSLYGGLACAPELFERFDVTTAPVRGFAHRSVETVDLLDQLLLRLRLLRLELHFLLAQCRFDAMSLVRNEVGELSLMLRAILLGGLTCLALCGGTQMLVRLRESSLKPFRLPQQDLLDPACFARYELRDRILVHGNGLRRRLRIRRTLFSDRSEELFSGLRQLDVELLRLLEQRLLDACGR